jgi:hypothetical protein
MTKRWLVLIPSAHGRGQYEYELFAASSMEAAAEALRRHESYEKVADETIITVIVEGKSLRIWDTAEHNAKQPRYRHWAKVVRSHGQRS